MKHRTVIEPDTGQHTNSIPWTITQMERLRELDADTTDLDLTFGDKLQRDRQFQSLEGRLAALRKQELQVYREKRRRPAWCRLADKLTDRLVAEGFVQVTTPTIMAGRLLQRMGIGPSHPLNEQVYWLGDGKCLRPMLAPHLYHVLRDLLRLWERPVRIFELGSCFRRESRGKTHASEFTMINLVEMGLPEDQRMERLAWMAQTVMEISEVPDYRLVRETSEVYGETLDVVWGPDELELGSGAMGPHPLDAAWRIRDSWVGIGFGVERLVMARDLWSNLSRVARSLSYLDGVSLGI